MDIFQTEPGLGLTPTQQRAFVQYANLLQTWNQKFNLTAIRDPDEIWHKHFLDSLTCLRAMRGTPLQRVIDVGTGAGFPGLVLKIACPEIHLTLVEAVAKKAAFCAEVVHTLGLDHVEIQTARAEALAQAPAHREQYDWAVARAVAPLSVLAEYLLPFVKVGGKMLAQKGQESAQEVKQAENALSTLGGELEQVLPVPLPGGEAHTLIVIAKVRPTPDRFPRRVGIPAKRPL
ncbi:MAG: 16S rRNA (guanine(527)-N(7))-methyltransferase RsmG [Anaerolineales bacterium]|jgi:16S rRNA (guanine527-N7)-methyltransferase|nr:16S rRNA (guanine(527)-N(7))-methyltransferase RsmG [Anaerolineales bacterium]